MNENIDGGSDEFPRVFLILYKFFRQETSIDAPQLCTHNVVDTNLKSVALFIQ